ncbi:MAG: DUF899 family protein [Opitutaceae bacterium]|nr:DUF899 family protein [Opitutaceae bacterium]
MKAAKKHHALRRKIERLERKLVRQHQKLAELKRELPLQPVKDYLLAGRKGRVRLSSLFGAKSDLIIVHSMGRSCRYCTMWADSFNGLLPHLEDRAAFVVVSPDTPAVQHAFAQGRGWRFPFYSDAGSSFSKDLGFLPEPDEPCPGVSTFVKRGRKIYRVASAPFGPYDPFCSVWHFFALLADGAEEWAPRFRYMAQQMDTAR